MVGPCKGTYSVMFPCRDTGPGEAVAYFSRQGPDLLSPLMMMLLLLLLPDLVGWDGYLEFSSSLGSCPQPAYNIAEREKPHSTRVLFSYTLHPPMLLLLPAHKKKHPTIWN